jgi:hypothetical protein
MRTARPRPAWSSTKPSSIIATLREVSWNLVICPIYLRSLSSTIAPRSGASSILLMG